MSEAEPYPSIVYKYRSWSNIYHQNLLRLNELYLSSPRDFNDPFDCRIPENFYQLDTPEKITEYIDEFMERNTAPMLQAGLDPAKQVEFLNEKLNNSLAEFQAYNEKETFERQDNNYGVLSLSGRWDSILMWSHYADLHKGYCVGLHEEKIRNSGFFGRGGNVIYASEDDFPIIDPRDQNLMRKALIQTHYKSKEWTYEDEYRLTSLLLPTPTTEDRKRHIPDDFFTEIIIGVQMPEDHKTEIIEIALQKNIAVYQAVKVPFKFLIDRVPIK